MCAIITLRSGRDLKSLPALLQGSFGFSNALFIRNPSPSDWMISPDPFLTMQPLDHPNKNKPGAQPHNTNALKLGTWSAQRINPFRFTRTFIAGTRQSLFADFADPRAVIDRARLSKVELLLRMLASNRVLLTASPLDTSLTRLIKRAALRLAPARRRNHLLALLARDPFVWFHLGCRLDRVSRDSDSFTAVTAELPRYPPLPPDHPHLATNLTDDQWAVLAPLIPPDPHLDHLTGQPPILIAANRWQFTRYAHTSPARDRQVLAYYHKILSRFPGLRAQPGLINNDPPSPDNLSLPSTPLSTCTGLFGKSEGFGERSGDLPPDMGDLPPDMGVRSASRLTSPSTVQNPFSFSALGENLSALRVKPSYRVKKTSPRRLLDAILWKLATGHRWADLPVGFPSPRLCQAYYRRLYRSGRWYTLMLALYNHLRSRAPGRSPAGTPPNALPATPAIFHTLLRAGWITTTPSQKIALAPAAFPTSGNYTALLFMQLARSACTRLQRRYQETHPHSRTSPGFRGASHLSTARLIRPSSRSSIPNPQSSFPDPQSSIKNLHSSILPFLLIRFSRNFKKLHKIPAHSPYFNRFTYLCLISRLLTASPPPCFPRKSLPSSHNSSPRLRGLSCIRCVQLFIAGCFWEPFIHLSATLSPDRLSRIGMLVSRLNPDLFLLPASLP